MKFSVRLKLVILFLFIGLLLSLQGVNYPYAGMYNANNNYPTLAAKNYIRFGFTKLKFFPTYFAGQRLPSPIPYYLHHPILKYLLTTIPFMIFGFHNWVGHVADFLFVLGDIFLIYLIGLQVWNKKVGLWAAGLAAIFPMTTFFWKYIIFEQGSLFFNLCIFYFVYTYLRLKNTRDLILIFLFTLLSGFMDWGVLYLFIPLCVLFVTYKVKLIVPFVVYLTASGLSIGLFNVSVFLLQGGFGELTQAIGVHGYTPALLGFSLWPFRLAAITTVRFALYFTPFSLLWFRGIRKSPVLLFFFLFGSMNIFVLPSVTWEDSFFLFYFIPFLAFSGALWMTRQEKKGWWFLVIVLTILLSSIVVNYFKMAQAKKQLWQYDAAKEIQSRLVPFEKVGVVEFSGDILEQYFFHPTQPMDAADLTGWQNGSLYPELSKVIVSGTLITKDSKLLPRTSQSQNGVLKWYRIIRDIFSVGQI